MSSQLVWLITGTSAGFGRDLTLLLLRKGDLVIATARQTAAIQDLKEAGAAILQLDVTSPLESLNAIAAEAVKIYGRVDVVVNNAGYIEVGALEESSPEETYKQFDTNVFGALNVTRAFLPYQRERKSGTVVFIGSLAGWRGVGGFGLYCATKHAIRAIAESLEHEIKPLGLRSIYLEPGYFRTAFLNPGKRSTYIHRISDYTEMMKRADDALAAANNNQPGDPQKFVQFLADYVRREGPFEGKELPIGLPVGKDTWNAVLQTTKDKQADLEAFKDVIQGTDLD